MPQLLRGAVMQPVCKCEGMAGRLPKRMKAVNPSASAANAEAIDHLASMWMRAGTTAALNDAAEAQQSSATPDAARSPHFALHGRGAHRALQIEAASAVDSCSSDQSGPQGDAAARLVGVLDVPPSVFFDPFELQRSLRQRGGIQVKVHGAVDIEAYAARSISACVTIG